MNEPTRLDDVPTSHGSASDHTFAEALRPRMPMSVAMPKMPLTAL